MLDASDADASSALDEPAFQRRAAEREPRKPYLPVVQHLDLPLGTAVLALAFPRLPCLAAPDEQPSVRPPLLQQDLVVALACADASVRLLTLPLLPPSPKSKLREKFREDPSRAMAGRGSWGEQLVTIEGAQGHQSLPRGISVAFTRRPVEGDPAEEDEDEDDEDDEMTDAESKPAAFDVVVASHSADLGGTVLVHRIPIADDGFSLAPDAAEHLVWRRIRLSAPASHIDLLALPPPSRKPVVTPPVRILITTPAKPVRIFDCSTPTHPRGAFTLALSAGLTAHPSAIPQHRLVLDARWALGGCAVAALTADGEWGLWDVAASSSARPVTGAVPTPFALTGRLAGPLAPAPAPSASTAAAGPPAAALAPMTPGTRKARQNVLFARPAPAAPASACGSEARHGGIALHVLDPRDSATAGGPEELAVFWLGSRALAVPRLRAQFAARARGSSRPASARSAGGERPALRAREVPSWAADLRGDRAVGVCALPVRLGGEGLGGTDQPELVVAGERALVVLASPLPDDQDAREDGEEDEEGEEEDEEGVDGGGEMGVRWADGRRIEDGRHTANARDGLEELQDLRPGQLNLEEMTILLDRMDRREGEDESEEEEASVGDEDYMAMDGVGPESPSLHSKRARRAGVPR